MGLIVITNDHEPAAYLCRICKATFTADEHAVYERHVINCYDANEAELRALSMRERNSVLFDHRNDGPSADLQRWVDKHREAINEGRKKI